MKSKVRETLVEIISALFIILFAYAALTKIEDFEKFRIELGKSPILSLFAKYVAVGIPLIELVIAALLALKKMQYYALYLSFSLMVVFSVYIIVILKFGTYIPCSCGGILQNLTWSQHLFFNIGFVILGALSILIYPKDG
ncbi:hypothetical protein HQN86_24970 [Pedobacter panaciterrae]|uniref:MauE/DoxX family redox-associated membrane protein n=1 Tax=Pedobacter panaciterrae TaxID=363849 RepID=UPI00155DA8D0|nr:MauE/DoxX family redox-associated membrane protein [Pedobacter panaciterrae]NQX56894.1 hypothetical protein [Pedobacter panaciterrae]